MAAIVLLALGALFVVAGTTYIYWPAGLIVAGLAVGLLGYDLTRPDGEDA